jgi:hypothetical protein
MRRSSTEALIAACKELAATVHCDDGVANSALREIAERLEELETVRQSALENAERYGGIDGAHHKTWVIDQMVRALTGRDYDATIKMWCDGEDGPETYAWDCGVAP